MKRKFTGNTHNVVTDHEAPYPGDLNESVLEAAADGDEQAGMTETLNAILETTTDDEFAEDSQAAKVESVTESDATVAECLVGAGVEEADREQRLASRKS